jgi:hypothetical protein
MKSRDLVLPTGERFSVPQYIYRIDRLSTHGWQLRYDGSALFSDRSPPCNGPEDSLALAIRELMRRLSQSPMPTMLRKNVAKHKRLDLPVGISGPVVRYRARNNIHESRLSVLLPRFGQAAKRASVYISTEKSYTEAKFERALQKAIAMREEASIAYREAELTASRAMADGLNTRLSPSLKA